MNSIQIFIEAIFNATSVIKCKQISGLDFCCTVSPLVPDANSPLSLLTVWLFVA